MVTTVETGTSMMAGLKVVEGCSSHPVDQSPDSGAPADTFRSDRWLADHLFLPAYQHVLKPAGAFIGENIVVSTLGLGILVAAAGGLAGASLGEALALGATFGAFGGVMTAMFRHT